VERRSEGKRAPGVVLKGLVGGRNRHERMRKKGKAGGTGGGKVLE